MSVAVNDEDDDARDLAAAAAGDHDAFGRLYDRHAAVVLSLCRSAIASPSKLADADDALQETFIRAHAMLDRLQHTAIMRGEGGLRSWLYAIARRVCSERRRAATRRLHHEGVAMHNGALMIEREAMAQASLVVERVDEHDALDRLGAALDQLDDRERLAVHLFYLDADPVRAAESALGLSRSGFYKLLARAKDKLAALMREVKTT
jgi:RNA polymerase sigma-70 factor, ECF subfamily